MAGDYDLAYVALSLIPQFGVKKLDSLMEAIGEPHDIVCAPVETLKQVQGIGEKTAQRIASSKLPEIAIKIKNWQSKGIQVITRNSPRYPLSLASLDDAPLTIFTLGNTEVINGPMVAIVGTRNPQPQARKYAECIARKFADDGYGIVSGLALGIDAAAHTGALESGKTPTIAVLGGGVLNIYPPQHRQLADRIAQHGALISENPPQATATAPRLVVRNRLISAFAQHIIVVETASDGGAMYAVRAAQSQGKKIYTLDLPTSGNQELIANGATIIDMDNPTLPPAVN